MDYLTSDEYYKKNYCFAYEIKGFKKQDKNTKKKINKIINKKHDEIEKYYKDNIEQFKKNVVILL